MQVSVIIPTIPSRTAMLTSCLRALSDQNLPPEYEVIVVCDGGQCPRDLGMTSDFADLRVLTTDGGIGPGAARNMGASVATSSILAFIDDDAVAQQDWLRAGAARFIARGIVCLKGKVIVPGGAALTPLHHGMWYDGGPGSPGVNLWVRAESFWKVGGFRHEYSWPAKSLWHHEDTDLTCRLHRVGAVEYGQEVVVAHPLSYVGWKEPFRYARKSYFDALLARDCRNTYEALVQRQFGPVTLRRARTRFRLAIVVASLLTLWSLSQSSIPLTALAGGTLIGLAAVSVWWKSNPAGRRLLGAFGWLRCLALEIATAWVFVRWAMAGSWRFRNWVF